MIHIRTEQTAGGKKRITQKMYTIIDVDNLRHAPEGSPEWKTNRCGIKKNYACLNSALEWNAICGEPKRRQDVKRKKEQRRNEEEWNVS